MKFIKNKYYKMLIGILFGSIFLWLAFKEINFREVGHILTNINYIYFVIAFFLGGAEFVLRAYRWKILLSPIKNIRLGNSFLSLVVGYAINIIIPMRVGEFAKAVILGYKENIPTSAVFATVLVKRAMGISTLLFMFLIFLPFVDFPIFIKQLALLLLFIVICFICIILLRPKFTKRIFNLLPTRFTKKLINPFTSFINSIIIIRKRKILIQIILIDILIWLYTAGTHYVVFRAMNMHISFYIVFIATIVICIGLMLPSPPGFIGNFHYFAIIGLGIFGIQKDIALSFSIIAHIVEFLPVLILGFICSQKLGFSILNGKRS